MRIEKVLVCITIQENSKRLIEKGAQIMKRHDCELHILHIESGKNLLSNQGSITLMESLFELGKVVGGEVHWLSADDVAKSIVQFISDKKITQVVLGESMRSRLHQLLKGDIQSYIRNNNQAYDILVLDRNDSVKEPKPMLPNEFAYNRMDKAIKP